MTEEETAEYAKVENNFKYHAPNTDQVERYQEIRTKARELAHLINTCCPISAERTISIKKLEEFVFWANASIARNE